MTTYSFQAEIQSGYAATATNVSLLINALVDSADSFIETYKQSQNLLVLDRFETGTITQEIQDALQRFAEDHQEVLEIVIDEQDLGELYYYAPPASSNAINHAANVV